MASRARSLASRVVASISSEQPCSSQMTSVEDNCSPRSTLRRAESFAAHLRKYSAAVDEADLQKLATNSGNGRLDLNEESVSRQEELALANEAITNQSFAYQINGEKMNGTVIGPGGVNIPPMNQLRQLLPNGTVQVMCVTWNIAEAQSSFTAIRALLADGCSDDKPDVVAVSFQELPPTNARYHQEAVKLATESLGSSYAIFCWVRKWSQMMMMFIRKEMIPYSSAPEWQFISCTALAKPLRTKGAIAVYFRLFQSPILFIACHLSFGPLIYRLNDYAKICDLLKFSSAGLQSSRGEKNADAVFWFGDLNFRLKSRERVDVLSAQSKVDATAIESLFSLLLADDELTIEKRKGNVFDGFREPHVTFPPTHKFVMGTNDYDLHRIPSYTDRVLYYSADENRIRPLVYDSLWEENCSDHKPVYASFAVRVVDYRH